MFRRLASLLLVFLLAQCQTAPAQIVGTLPYTFTNGSTADATQVMANYNWIVNQVNANAASSGANVNITSLSGLTTPIRPAFGGSPVYMGNTSTGSSNAYVVSSGAITPTGYSLGTYNIVCFYATFTNTAGTPTLNFSGSGVKNILKITGNGLVPLEYGNILSGQYTCLLWDSVQYELLVPSYTLAQGTLASAATVDMGTQGSHVVNITGSTTITSFGSTASVNDPYYQFICGSNVQITYNATSMLTPQGANIFCQSGGTGWMQYLGSGNWRIWTFTNGTPQSVLVYLYSSGSGTYTPGYGATKSFVSMVAAGGGGGGSTGAGSNGNSSSFASWTTIGGNGGGGGSGGGGGTGGTGGANGTGTLVLRQPGGTGGVGFTASIYSKGGDGGSSCMGNGGFGPTSINQAGTAGTGYGGAGAGATLGTLNGAGGGGGGECVQFWVFNPSASSYSVGAGVSGGSGTAGGSSTGGYISVQEYYN